MGKKWTEEEIKLLEELYKQGKTFKEIAEKVERTWGSVRDKSLKLHLREKYPKIPIYKQDLTGMKFGKLTVVKQLYPDNNCHMLYECECECGNKTITTNSNLILGHTKSCGCLVAETMSKNMKKYNKYDLSGEYGIGYTTDGKEFYFDLEDYDKIKNYCWSISSHGYVTSRDEHQKIQMLHRVIMGISRDHNFDNIDVDHIGGSDTVYDNRKINLRLATKTQNCMNRSLQRNNTSGVTGVSYNSTSMLWEAQLTKNKKIYHLGSYFNKEDAIKARKAAEEKYFQEWSYDNSQKHREITNT